MFDTYTLVLVPIVKFYYRKSNFYQANVSIKIRILIYQLPKKLKHDSESKSTKNEREVVNGCKSVVTASKSLFIAKIDFIVMA